MFCENCGTRIPERASACSSCGTAAQAAPVYATHPASYQQPYGQAAAVAAAQTNEVMTVGNWMVTMLICAIPVAGIIFLFLWAFGKGATLTKRNFSRAMLIFMAIGVGFGIVATLLSLLLI